MWPPTGIARAIWSGLTGGPTLPAGACRSWSALYAGLTEFLVDFENHMRLENEVLFPQFEPGGRAQG